MLGSGECVGGTGMKGSTWAGNLNFLFCCVVYRHGVALSDHFGDFYHRTGFQYAWICSTVPAAGVDQHGNPRRLKIVNFWNKDTGIVPSLASVEYWVGI